MNKTALFRDYLKQSILLVTAVKQIVLGGVLNQTGARTVAMVALESLKKQHEQAFRDLIKAYRDDSKPIGERFTKEGHKLTDKICILDYHLRRIGAECVMPRACDEDALLRLYALYIGYQNSHRHARLNKEVLKKFNSDTILPYLLDKFFSHHVN